MKLALSYDDVLIVPKYSDIQSRSECRIQSHLTPALKYDLPVLSSPMDTITEYYMARTMASYGGLGVIHRFMDVEDQVKHYKHTNEFFNCSCAIGVTGGYKTRVQELYKAGCRLFTLDVAHGDHVLVKKALHFLKDTYKDISIIAGNIATREGSMRLAEWGADSIRVGIGGGCLAGGTRILMANGTYKNIEDIKIHEKVINKNGDSVEVKGIQFSGYKKVKKLNHTTFYDDLLITNDHQLYVGDLNSLNKKYAKESYVTKLNKTKKILWKPTEKIKEDVLLSPKNINFDEIKETFTIDMSTFVESRRNFKGGLDPNKNSKIQPSYDLGYIFGTFLGDGIANTYCNKSGIGKWYFSLNENKTANKLIKSIKNVFNVESNKEKTNNMIIVSLRKNYLIRLLMNLYDENKIKKLPNKYFCSNKKYLQGVLDGLIDSDGYVEENGQVNFFNTSKYLIELFNVACYIVNGFFPHNRKARKSTGNLKNANIENLKQPYCARINTTAEKRLNDDYQLIKYNSLDTYETIVPTYDIQTDETQSFIANNIIVHNSLCSTRIQTGIGIPMISCILDIADAIDEYYPNVSIIADGGIRTSGDVAKALAAGADFVMLGSMLAGTEETPGSIIRDGKYPYKLYRGSASFESKSDRGESKYIEGVSTTVPYKGYVGEILNSIKDGVQSAMSYVGARDLAEFQAKSEFIQITSAGYKESTPHLLGE